MAHTCQLPNLATLVCKMKSVLSPGIRVTAWKKIQLHDSNVNESFCLRLIEIFVTPLKVYSQLK